MFIRQNIFWDSGTLSKNISQQGRRKYRKTGGAPACKGTFGLLDKKATKNQVGTA